ncbi:sugar MFS transporter [Candidatus Zixiibacteriota bacterium]
MKTLPIFVVFFIMGFGDAVGTLVGFVQEEFSISPALAGLLPFFGFLAFGLFSVPFGIMGGRKGKKYVLVLALILVTIGELIPVISIASYVFVLAAIFLIGVGMTALQVAGNPIMRDVSPEGMFSRNLTFAQFIKSIGSNTAPYVVPLLAALGLAAWNGIFTIYALVAGITLVVVMMMKIDESVEEESAETVSIRSSFALLKEPFVLMMVLGIFFYVGAEVGLNSWIATFLSDRFGFDLASMATLGIGFFLTALAIGRLFGSIVLNFLTPSKFFLCTSILGVVGILGMFSGSQTLVLISIFLAGLAFGNIFPLIFSILIDSMPERSNELSGLMVMAIVGGALIPPIMGLIASTSITLSFLVPLAIFLYITFLAVYSGGRKGADAAAG